MAFAPKLGPEDFRAPFTTANAWGTFSQKQKGKGQTERIEIRYGDLSISELKFALTKDMKPSKVSCRVDGQEVDFAFKYKGKELSISFAEKLNLTTASILEIKTS